MAFKRNNLPKTRNGFTRNNLPKNGNKTNKSKYSPENKNDVSKLEKTERGSYKGVAGRPTKYRPWMCEKAIEIQAKGHSRAAVAAEFNININTLLDWESKIPEFSRALAIGYEKSKRWWEDKGHSQCSGDKFNTTVYGLIMANRYGYNSRQKIEASIEASLEHKGKVEIEHDPRKFTAEVLDVLLQSGMLKTEIDRVTDSEDDEVHQTSTDA